MHTSGYRSIKYTVSSQHKQMSNLPLAKYDPVCILQIVLSVKVINQCK